MANNQSIMELLEDKIRKNISGYSEEAQAVFNSCDYRKLIEKSFLKIYKFESQVRDLSLEEFSDYYYEELIGYKCLEYRLLPSDLSLKIDNILANEEAEAEKKKYQDFLNEFGGHADSTETDVLNMCVANYISSIKSVYESAASYGSKLYLDFNDMAWSEAPETNLSLLALLDHKSSLKNIINKLNKFWWSYGHADALALKAKARLTDITTKLEKDVSEMDRLYFTAQAVYKSPDKRDELIRTLLNVKLPVSKLAMAEAAVNDNTINDERMEELLFGIKPGLKLLEKNEKRA